MRRRGLVRSAARGAVIAGAATAASGRVARRQQQKFSRQDEVRAPSPAAAAPNHHGSDIVASLRELAEMKTSGALTEKEYTAAKARVLDGG